MKLKKIIIVLLALAVSLGLLVSCQDKNGEGGEDSAAKFYTVTFASAGGTEIEPKQVREGTAVSEPPVPEKKGYIFGGWFDGGSQWDFSSKVTKDMTLTAKWISPENYFEYTPSPDGKTATLTGLKQKSLQLRLPTEIGGYTVTAIGEGAFEKLSSEEVKSIIIPDTVVSIGNNAFKGCADISISVEGQLISVGEWAFDGCGGLSTVKLSEGLESISAYAFQNTGLTSVSIPESTRIIDENAFNGCGSLKTLYIHDRIEAVNDNAFMNIGLVAVYFYGTEENIAEVLDSRVYGQNDGLENAKKFVYSKTEPAADTAFEDFDKYFNGFWYLDSNGKTKLWK